MKSINKQIALSSVIRFLIYFFHWMVLAHLPVLLKHYGFTDVRIGVTIGLLALSSMALMLPMGAFSDFFSPKRTILAGAVLFGVYFAALRSVRSFTYMIPVVVIGGLGIAALIVVSESLYLKQFGREKRGVRVAIYQLCTYLGFGLGPLTGALLLQHGTVRMFDAAVLGAFLIFCLGLFLKDYGAVSFSFRKYGEDIFQFKPLLLIACIFVLGTHFGVEQSSFSLLMRENLGFSPKTIGFVFSGIGLWMAVIVLFIGRLHDKRESVFIFLLCGMAVSGLFQFLTTWAFDFRSLLIIRLMHTMGDAVALLELSVLIAMFFPSDRLGGNSGLLYSIRTMATFIAAVMCGWINRNWDYSASFFTSGILMAIFVTASVLYVGTSSKRMKAVGWVGNDE